MEKDARTEAEKLCDSRLPHDEESKESRAGDGGLDPCERGGILLPTARMPAPVEKSDGDGFRDKGQDIREKALEILRKEFPPPGKASVKDEKPSPGSPSLEPDSDAPGSGVKPSTDVSLASPKVPAKAAAEPELIPARMLNEFVYCQRLFYYEFVEGVFVESADTLRGGAIHQRVDSGSGALPAAKGNRSRKAEAEETSGGTLTLASQRA